MIFKFSAKVDKIFSANYYLNPAKSRNGGVYLYMNPEARRYKESLIEQFKEQAKDLNREFDIYTKIKKVAFYFGLKNGGRRDVSNMIKLTEDALCEALGIDDSVVNYRQIVTDVKIENDLEHEIVVVVLEI